MQHSWRRNSLVWASLLAASLAAACGGGSGSSTDISSNPRAVDSDVPDPGAPASQSRPRIVALGDSLTAGLGLRPEQAYPALLQERLDVRGLQYEVVNAGVSGDTSAGGLRRLDWVLDGDVRILIVALGGNDGLRGLPAEALRSNLAEIIERAQAREIAVLLAGMEAPTNLGTSYTGAFRDVYRSLAEEYDVPLMPFLLAGVGGIERLNQSDGIHPNAEGTRLVADLVWTALLPLLEDDAKQRDQVHGTHAASS